MDEIWKEVPIYGGNYEVSSLGRIRSKKRTVTRKHSCGSVVNFKYKSRILNPTEDKDGYKHVHLGYQNKKYTEKLHSLICLTFNGPHPTGKPLCLHKNGDPSCDYPDNLYWGDHQDNMNDRKAHGKYKVGENHVMSKLTEDQAIKILSSNKKTKELSRIFGVNYYTVWDIRNGRSWKHLNLSP